MFKGAKKHVQSLYSSLKKTVTRYWRQIIGFVSENWTRLIGFFRESWTQLTGFFRECWTQLTGYLTRCWPQFFPQNCTCCNTGTYTLMLLCTGCCLSCSRSRSYSPQNETGNNGETDVLLDRNDTVILMSNLSSPSNLNTDENPEASSLPQRVENIKINMPDDDSITTLMPDDETITTLLSMDETQTSSLFQSYSPSEDGRYSDERQSLTCSIVNLPTTSTPVIVNIETDH